jgi:hypothetical protein
VNPLDQYPELRKYLYMLQWIVNGVVTIAGAYFLLAGTAMEDLPTWYVLTVGIAPVLWTYLGITAQTNVPIHTPQHAAEQTKPPDDDPPVAPPMYPDAPR